MKVKIGEIELDLLPVKNNKEAKDRFSKISKKYPLDGVIIEDIQDNLQISSEVGNTLIIFVKEGKVLSMINADKNIEVDVEGDTVIKTHLKKLYSQINIGDSLNMSSKKMKDGGSMDGDMYIVNENGELDKSIEDASRIVSRKETKKLFQIVSKKNSEKELGLLMVEIINGQNSRDKEYVTT